MIYQDEAEFARSIKNYDPQRVYFLYGEQNYLKKLYCKKIIAQAVSGMEDFNLTRLDGTRASLDEISDALEALPMMGGHRCVVVNDLDVGKLSVTEAGKLTELLADLPETGVLVFTTTDLAPEIKKGAKWKAFIKQVDAVGAVIELKTRSTGDRNRFLQTLAERAGCRITSENCAFLAERCGNDMQVLQHEMDKLCAYKGASEITKEDISLCAVAQLDASVFDLAKLMLKNDYQAAMQNLDELIRMREEPVAVLGVLSGGFIDLYRAKAAKENGKPAEELCALLQAYRGKEWRVKNAMRDCGRYTHAQLAEVLELLARADYRLKSSRTENTVILQETVTHIMAVLQGVPARR